MKISIFSVKSFIQKTVIMALAFAGFFIVCNPSAQAMEFYANRRDFNLKQGASFSTGVSIDRYGYSGPVTFSFSGARGIVGSISQNPVTGNTATATFRASATAPLGIQYMILTASTGREVRRQQFEINVTKGSTPTTAPRLSVNPTSVNFPVTLIGQAPAVQSFMISNSGSGTTALNISAVSLSGADVSQFSINASLCQGASLTAGASCAVSVAAASPSAARAFNASITITASTGSVSVPVSLQGTDYSLSLSPASVGLNPGSSASVTVNVNRNLNASTVASGAINVSVSGLPAGVSANSITITSGSNSGVVTLAAVSTAASTSAPSTVTFTSNLSGRIKTTSASVSVVPIGSFSLTASPNPLTITQGQLGAVSVSIARSSFTSGVTLSATALPSGVTATSTTTTGNSASLTLTVASTAIAGTYPIVIRGVGGSITQSAALSLVVRALPADFTLSLSPSSVTVNPGSSGSFTANLSRTNFTGSVNFSLSGLPEGVTGSCPATSGNSATCTLSASASAIAGTTNVSVQASGSSIQKTATLSLRVGSAEGLKAFPGAEGFGADTTSGGRGGVVCKVTTLNPTGAGSLQACMDLPEAAYIVFTVSGVIDKSLECHAGNKTIAGQTSPAGVIVRELIADNVYEANPNCKNYIIRHMRFRAGGGERSIPGPLYGDTMRLDGVSDFVIDHSAFERSNDEAFQLSRSRNIIVQYSTIAETLSSHYWGGMLINYSNVGADLNDLSIHHNLWTGIQARFPEISCEENGDGGSRLGASNCTNKRLRIELSNNMIYDPTDPIWYNRCTNTNGGNECSASSSSFFVDMNWIGNYMRDRTGSNNPVINGDLMGEARNDVYYADNYFDTGIANLVGFSMLSIASPFPYPEITYTPGIELPDHLTDNVGPFPRDPMDTRLVGYLSQNINSTPTATGSRPNDTFNLLPASCAPLSTANDSDNDGMNDNWERRKGLNVGIQDHNGTALSSEGYTNIEVYLNELSDRVIAAGSSTSGVCD